MKKNIWSNPNGFSILDVLAISFASVFLLSAVYIMVVPAMEQIEVLRILAQPVIVILGGYFGDQIVKGYSDGKLEQVSVEANCEDFRQSV